MPLSSNATLWHYRNVDPLAKQGTLLDGEYKIVRRIGQGSMAQVFAAEKQNGEKVAIKILDAKVGADDSSIKRFEREAIAQSRIQSKYVAKVMGAGITPLKNPYLVVELLEGNSLRRTCKGGPIPTVHASSYIWQTLQGLSAAHRIKIVHRDLKPANIMLEPSKGPVPRVVVIDFGFASLGGATRLTMRGQVVGSLSYMAPERFSSKEPGTPQTDVYSASVIFYQLLTGVLPFKGKSDFEIIQHQMQMLPTAPHLLNPTVPMAISEIVMTGLEKSLAKRFQSAHAMSNAIEATIQTL